MESTAIDPSTDGGSPAPPGQRSKGPKDRLVMVAIRVSPESAAPLAADLGDAIAMTLRLHAGRLLGDPSVISQDYQDFAEIMFDTGIGQSSARLASMSVQAGDWVLHSERDGEGYVARLRKVMLVEPAEGPDGPYFWLDGFSDRVGWAGLHLPHNERERAFWSLEVGDSISYWCPEVRDSAGRRRKPYGHSVGSGCRGGGVWHTARVTHVERADWDGDRIPSLYVEGNRGAILPTDWEVTGPHEDGLLHFMSKPRT